MIYKGAAFDALRTSEMRYRRLFESARDGILILDAESRKITDANPYMAELLGYRRDEFVGKELWEIGLFEDEAASAAAFGKLQRTGYIRYEDLPLETSKGAVWEVEFVSNVYEENGRQVIQCNIRDITERRQTERELRQLKESLERRVAERTAALEDAYKDLESFSYSISHDLRAPLRAIEGFTGALIEDCAHALDAKGQDYLSRTAAASRHMTRLIDHLLKLSLVARADVHRETVDLSDMIRQTAEKMKASEPQRAGKFDIEDGIIVSADRHLLQIAVENLIENAWKFTAKRQSAEIAFGRRQSADKTEYFVRDNGAGFDMAHADRLFGAFQRLHTAQEFEGTGIGLATVQRIVRRHGGVIRAESAPDAGATFYFTL